jgi:hypothetical protein
MRHQNEIRAAIELAQHLELEINALGTVDSTPLLNNSIKHSLGRQATVYGGGAVRFFQNTSGEYAPRSGDNENANVFIGQFAGFLAVDELITAPDQSESFIRTSIGALLHNNHMPSQKMFMPVNELTEFLDTGEFLEDDNTAQELANLFAQEQIDLFELALATRLAKNDPKYLDILRSYTYSVVRPADVWKSVVAPQVLFFEDGDVVMELEPTSHQLNPDQNLTVSLYGGNPTLTIEERNEELSLHSLIILDPDQLQGYNRR